MGRWAWVIRVGLMSSQSSSWERGGVRVREET